MEPILTIIIPAYNISLYVDECLPTYINDRLFEKIKVILIDDGATDDTKEKVERYCERYPDIFTFVH